MKIRFELLNWAIGLVLVIGETFVSTSNSSLSLSFPPVLPPNPNDDTDPELAKRRDFVVDMMKHAWDGYVKCAWGYSRLHPYQCSHNDDVKSGEFIWTAIPALWIMGLRDEFDFARKWVETLNYTEYFESNNGESASFVGAMLSCYSLTGDELFRDSALKYASRYIQSNWSDGFSDMASAYLEYPYLSDLTGNGMFRSHLTVVDKKIKDAYKDEEDQWRVFEKMRISSGNYLLLKVKRYIQSNQMDNGRMGQTLKEIEELRENEQIYEASTGLIYFVKNRRSRQHSRLVFRQVITALCNIGATLALDAELLPIAKYGKSSWRILTTISQLKDVIAHWELARGLTDTCHLLLQSETLYRGIPSYAGDIDVSLEEFGSNKSRQARFDIPRPTDDMLYLGEYAMIESYFILWRTTKQTKYRDHAWKMVSTINEITRVQYGFIDRNAKTSKWNRVGVQPPLLFATLKYFYLMFTPDSFLPLDKWVLNAVGQPLPICGSGNPAYPNVKCS